MATSSEVARYIVRFFQEAGDPVTNLKLQKLLYYVQGWSLAINDAPAFNERLEAWVHGPVQPGVYGEYRGYRWNPIDQAVEWPNLGDELTALTKEVIDAYGNETAWELERRTHTEEPWTLARNGIPNDQDSNAEISRDSMKNFFKRLADGK